MININILDKVFSHHTISSTSINNIPKFVNFNRDLANVTDDELIVYTDHNFQNFRQNSEHNIAWMLEPKEIHPTCHQYLYDNHDKFKEIWTHDDLLTTLPNAKILPYGVCWIEPTQQMIHDKSKLVSMIYSNKRQLTGHAYRHTIAEAFSVDKFGSGGGKPIDNKIEALQDYMFSVIVENSKSDWYFTEKIIDCFRTGTIPIYWGCNNIGKYFDTDGILCFSNDEELTKIFEKLTPDFYNSMLENVKHNFNIAEKHITIEDYLFHTSYVDHK
jgi:hypothetical protein